jgi:hypothetical protein
MSISYPVDVENTRWATWRISTAEIEKHNKPWPRHDGGEIVNLSPDIVPLLEVREDQPVYDPAIERVERADPVIDIPNNTHTHGWTVIPLTQEELDAIAQAEQDAADAAAELEQAKAMYQDLQDGVGTQLQRLVRVERVDAYLLKALFGAGQ